MRIKITDLEITPAAYVEHDGRVKLLEEALAKQRARVAELELSAKFSDAQIRQLGDRMVAAEMDAAAKAAENAKLRAALEAAAEALKGLSTIANTVTAGRAYNAINTVRIIEVSATDACRACWAALGKVPQ